MGRSVEVISHWHHSVEDLSTSSMEFYSEVEAALKRKQIDGLRTERLDWQESGILSAKRTYLRVGYGRYVFDVCAAPFGKDFFFSWWLGKTLPDFAALLGCLGVMAIPLVFLISIAALGFIKGIILFLVLVGVGVFVARSGAAAGESGIEDILIAVPVAGPIYKQLFRPVTYYSEDTRQIFEETVHRVVLDVVSGILTVNKMTPLTPEERALTKRTSTS